MVYMASSNMLKRDINDGAQWLWLYMDWNYSYLPTPGPQSRALCGVVWALSIAIVLYYIDPLC